MRMMLTLYFDLFLAESYGNQILVIANTKHHCSRRCASKFYLMQVKNIAPEAVCRNFAFAVRTFPRSSGVEIVLRSQQICTWRGAGQPENTAGEFEIYAVTWVIAQHVPLSIKLAERSACGGRSPNYSFGAKPSVACAGCTTVVFSSVHRSHFRMRFRFPSNTIFLETQHNLVVRRLIFKPGWSLRTSLCAIFFAKIIVLVSIYLREFASSSSSSLPLGGFVRKCNYLRFACPYTSIYRWENFSLCSWKCRRCAWCWLYSVLHRSHRPSNPRIPNLKPLFKVSRVLIINIFETRCRAPWFSENSLTLNPNMQMWPHCMCGNSGLRNQLPRCFFSYYVRILLEICVSARTAVRILGTTV